MAHVLSFAGFAIECQCRDAADWAWLSEFLAPAFEAVSHGDADVVVSHAADPARHALLRRQTCDRANGEKRVFTLDQGWVNLSVWPQDDGEIVFDHHYNAYYVVSSTRRKVEIVVTGEATDQTRRSLMRVVREFAMSYAQCRPGAMIHGAAFDLEGRGIVVAGPKRAGKTSFLLHALRTPGVAYISNDRTWVRDGGDDLAIHGMPTIVTLRETSLELLPALHEQVRGSGLWDYLTRDEATRQLAGNSETDPYGRYNLSNPQLCALLDAPAAAGGTLSAMLFPHVSDALGPASFKRLTSDAARAPLALALFGDGSAAVSELFALPFAGPPGPMPRRAIEMICARIPVFACRLGPAAFDDATWAERLLALL